MTNETNEPSKKTEQSQSAQSEPSEAKPASGDKVGGVYIPAPQRPVAGAILSSPLTGGGPHKGEGAETVKEKVQKGPPGIPKSGAPPKQPPKQPPQPKLSETIIPPDAVMPSDQIFLANRGVKPRLPPSSMDPAMASLMMRTLDATKQTAQMFYLVILPEDDWPRVAEFPNVGQLIEAIKEYLGTNTHVFPFMGQQLTITEGPNHFLHTPMGPLPLFDIPDPDATATVRHGWVGDDELEREQPPSTEEPLEEGGDDELENELDDDSSEDIPEDELSEEPAIADDGDDESPVF